MIRLFSLANCLMFLCLAVPVGRAEVVVNFTSTEGWIFHGAHRVNTLALNGLGAFSTHYNSAPTFAPFKSPDGTGGRFVQHPEHQINPTFFYGSIDGLGSFQSTPTGSYGSIPRVSGSFSQHGSNLPVSAMSGTLPSELTLPNGVQLTAGTTIYADFSGLRADFNNPEQWWYDQSSRTNHLIYRGGDWGFYYSPEPGSYAALATFDDVEVKQVFNYGTGLLTMEWSGNALLTNGLILPTSGNIGGGSSILLPLSGVIDEEVTDPTVGFYSRSTLTMNFSFDVENATVPEPTSLALCGPAILFFAATRRRRSGCRAC